MLKLLENTSPACLDYVFLLCTCWDGEFQNKKTKNSPLSRWSGQYHTLRFTQFCLREPPSGDLPGGAVVKNSANAGDTGSSPGPGRSHMPRSS